MEVLVTPDVLVGVTAPVTATVSVCSWGWLGYLIWSGTAALRWGSQRPLRRPLRAQLGPALWGLRCLQVKAVENTRRGEAECL